MDVLLEKQPRGHQRIRGPRRRRTIRALVRVTSLDAEAAVTPASSLGLGPWQRHVGTEEVHELARVAAVAAAQLPRRIRGQRREQLDATNAGELVAVTVDLRDPHAERGADPR